jgi:hypothetical protein
LERAYVCGCNMKGLLSTKRLLFLFLLIFPILGIMVLSSGCANIVPPQGGPRDTIPPLLVRATPADSTLNFRSKRIELSFDEYIDLQNAQQNLLVTPTFATSPQVDVRLRTMTIHLRDTLEPNTTYSFNFGNALRDINEGNVLPDFSYTFSTGPTFDTLSFGGNVIVAESGKVDTTLFAVLYRNPSDSAVVKERPRYISRLDSEGNFRFHNLPAGTFSVYVFGDAASGGLSTRRYNSRQYFAFADSPVVIRPATPPLTLYAYKAEAVPTTPASTTPQTPSNGRRDNNGGDRRLRFSTNLSGEQQDLLKNLVLTFEQPLRLYDSSRLRLTQDSTFTAVSYRTTLDSARRQLTLQTQWTPAATYNLILDKDFAEDTLGRRLLKSDTLSFTTRKLTDYGRLRIRLTNADTAQHPVLQLLQNNVVVYNASISSGQISIDQFTPGDYEVQILLDRNNNGKWDAGQFFGTKRQPEIVRPIDRRITVKGGSNNEYDISLE